MSLSSFIKTLQWFLTASESNSFAWKTGPSLASPPLLALHVKLGVHPQKGFSALEMPPFLLSLQGCHRVSFLLMECCDMGHKHTPPTQSPFCACFSVLIHSWSFWPWLYLHTLMTLVFHVDST